MNHHCDLWEPLSTQNITLAHPMTSLILSKMVMTLLRHISHDEQAQAFCTNFVLQATNAQGLEMRLDISSHMWPTEQKPGLPTNIEFKLEAILSMQVVFQLNSDYCTKVLQGACTVSYWIMKPVCATLSAWTHTQVSEYGNALLWIAKANIFKKGNFTSFHFVYGCLSVYRHNVSPPALLSFRTSLPTFKLPFYKNTSWFYVTR